MYLRNKKAGNLDPRHWNLSFNGTGENAKWDYTVDLEKKPFTQENNDTGKVREIFRREVCDPSGVLLKEEVKKEKVSNDVLEIYGLASEISLA